MRIRSTKPEFWRSRRVASVSWDARLVLKGLESYVDDNGVGKDDIALIVGDVFSRDMLANPRETAARVSEAISELQTAGLLWRYEADGTDLLFISFWEDVQRIDKPGKGRFRRPDGTSEYKESSIRESVASPREGVAPGTGEQGNRGTGEETPLLDKSSDDDPDADDPDDAFEEFWDTYDKKVGRKAARQKFKLALKKPGVTADVLTSAAAEYVEGQKREGKHPQYTKAPAAWLNGEHWTDERESRPPERRNTMQVNGPVLRPPSHLSTDDEIRDWYAANYPGLRR